ncbi:MAG: glycoside hydrolase family 32 protein [Bacteroidetes bacterium]|nr:glycoside hydrolase family 32 protein [Bacteroidota bacterium]
MKTRSLFFFCLASLSILSCNQQEIKFTPNTLEQFRPGYHFSPAKGWMNDPNGLIYIDGEYHLFFQHYPDSTVWGPMHWGHAVSKDLVNWEELPIALFPDSLGYIFSGSAVYDEENSSELGSKENPPLVALFTYHDPTQEKEGALDFQSQGLAYSLDKGNTWSKYATNPVLLNPGFRDFRDPKVTQITKENGQKSWLMTLAVKDQVHFYESANLKDWSLLGEFGKGIGAHGGVWECPDLIPMKATDGSQKWVLLVSTNPGGPQKGSATQYFIGDFKQGKFTPDDSLLRWLDYGPDNYAGVTWSNLPKDQDRNLWIGWMSNWDYAQVVPTSTWRSALTIPREINLFEVDGTLLLKSSPARELEKLRKTTYSISKTESLLPSTSIEILAEVTSDELFSLTFSNESGEELSISKEMGLVTIDRRKAGKTNFNLDFAAAHSAPMSWKAESIRIFLDASSIELFVNEGELVLTSTLFPSSPWSKIKINHGLDEVQLIELFSK